MAFSETLLPYLTEDKDASHLQFDDAFGTALTPFLEAAKEAGHDIQIYSGYRSPEHQARLFADAVKKYGSEKAARKWVAPAGKSRHNHGGAADLRYDTDAARNWAQDNAQNYGLNFRMSWEPWHIELHPNHTHQAEAKPKPEPKPVGAPLSALREDDEPQNTTTFASLYEYDAGPSHLGNRYDSGSGVVVQGDPTGERVRIAPKGFAQSNYIDPSIFTMSHSDYDNLIDQYLTQQLEDTTLTGSAFLGRMNGTR